MATEEVAFKITTDTSQTEKAVKSIKTELREATQEALNLSRKFGDTSKEAIEAQQKVANLRDEVGDFKDRVDALNPDAKFKAFSQTLQGVAGGFAGVQGAIGLFGTESAELEKQLLKVQSALALSEGLNSVLESKDAFTNLAVVIKKNVITAFTTLKGAIIATGIGAAVVAIGLLIANFDAVKKVVLNFIPGLAKVGEFIGKLVEQVTDFVGATSEASRAYDKLAGSNKTANEAIQRRIDLLSAQGGQEKEIAKLSKQLAENDLNTLRSKYKAEKGLRGEDLKNFEDLKNQKKIIEAEETVRLKAEGEKREADRKTARDKEIAEIAAEKARKEKEFADFVKKLQDESNAKKVAAEAERDLEASIIADLTEIDDADKQLRLEKEEARGETEILRANLVAERRRKDRDTETEEDKKAYEARLVAQQAFLQATASVFGQLSSLFGEGTAASKAAGLAEIAIQTGVGFANGLRIAQESAKATGPAAAFAFPVFYATQVGAVLAAANKARSILSKVKGGGGGGGVSRPNSGGTPSFNASSSASVAPIQAGINVQQTALTPGGNNVTLQNQQAIKAFVVETDITDSQDRINKIKAAATI
jgi:hypothetical protein